MTQGRRTTNNFLRRKEYHSQLDCGLCPVKLDSLSQHMWNALRIESHPPSRQVYNPCYQPIPVSIGKVEQLLPPGSFCIATNLRTPYLHNQAPRGMKV